MGRCAAIAAHCPTGPVRWQFQWNGKLRKHALPILQRILRLFRVRTRACRVCVDTEGHRRSRRNRIHVESSGIYLRDAAHQDLGRVAIEHQVVAVDDEQVRLLPEPDQLRAHHGALLEVERCQCLLLQQLLHAYQAAGFVQFGQVHKRHLEGCRRIHPLGRAIGVEAVTEGFLFAQRRADRGHETICIQRTVDDDGIGFVERTVGHVVHLRREPHFALSFGQRQRPRPKFFGGRSRLGLRQ